MRLLLYRLQDILQNKFTNKEEIWFIFTIRRFAILVDKLLSGLGHNAVMTESAQLDVIYFFCEATESGLSKNPVGIRSERR